MKLQWTDWFTIILVLLLTVFRILFHPYAIVIFYALLRLLVNVFSDLIIYKAESTQLVKTVVKSCLSAAFGTEYSFWCVLCRGMQASQAASNQYCPRSILVSPPPAWLHSTRTRAIRSFIALASI